MILPAVAAIPRCVWVGRHEFVWSGTSTLPRPEPDPWMLCVWCGTRYGEAFPATHSDGSREDQ